MFGIGKMKMNNLARTHSFVFIHLNRSCPISCANLSLACIRMQRAGILPQLFTLWEVGTLTATKSVIGVGGSPEKITVFSRYL